MTEPNAQPASQPAVPLSESEDRQWASFAHLGGILGFLPSLIIWLVFKERGSFTNQEAKEALNFQLTLLIAQVALYFIGTILALILIGFLFYFLAWAVWIAGIVFSIIGFVSAKDGKAYRYPFAIRMVK